MSASEVLDSGGQPSIQATVHCLIKNAQKVGLKCSGPRPMGINIGAYEVSLFLVLSLKLSLRPVSPAS